ENNLQKVNSERLSSYRGVEFVLDGLGQVAHCLQSYWEGVSFGKPITHIKDVLVCTHGMRDKCCARFGQPFFKAAERLETKPAFKDVRVWRVSHIGGHRFAPTAIVLPEGRYYAHLTLAALRALLTRSGEVSQLQPMYRGWGLLPKSLQVVERQLLLQIGWPWLDYRLSYRVISEEKKSVRAVLLTEFTESSGKMLTTYQVRVVKSKNDAHRIHTSCNDQCPFVPIQYAIADLSILTTQQHNRSPATTQPSQVCIPADTPVSKSGE
ncbi:MAG: sucrase ferredoxin, partial [Cyanobacteria bacterium J06560_2]